MYNLLKLTTIFVIFILLESYFLNAYFGLHLIMRVSKEKNKNAFTMHFCYSLKSVKWRGLSELISFFFSELDSWAPLGFSQKLVQQVQCSPLG